MISAVEERVTSVSNMLGGKVSDDRILEAMVEGFSEGLGVKLEPGEPTSEEWEMMKTIRSEKYGTREWNFKR